MQDKPQRPKPLPQQRQTLGVPYNHLPTPSPTPKSPCFVHSNLNRSSALSEIINRCDNELTEYSNLAETAVSVRELSKKLGKSFLLLVQKKFPLLIFKVHCNNRSSSNPKRYADCHNSHETRRFAID